MTFPGKQLTLHLLTTIRIQYIEYKNRAALMARQRSALSLVKPLDSTSVLKYKRDTNARIISIEFGKTVRCSAVLKHKTDANARMISIEFGKTVRCSPVLKHKRDTNARKISIEFCKTVRCTSVLKHKRYARVESENF